MPRDTPYRQVRALYDEDDMHTIHALPEPLSQRPQHYPPRSALSPLDNLAKQIAATPFD
jgi:hypothetical protein